MEIIRRFWAQQPIYPWTCCSPANLVESLGVTHSTTDIFISCTCVHPETQHPVQITAMAGTKQGFVYLETKLKISLSVCENCEKWRGHPAWQQKGLQKAFQSPSDPTLLKAHHAENMNKRKTTLLQSIHFVFHVMFIKHEQIQSRILLVYYFNIITLPSANEKWIKMLSLQYPGKEILSM